MCAFSVAQSCLIPHKPMDSTCRVPLAVGLSWQEYRSGLPFPSPEYLPSLRIKPTSSASPALAGGFTTESPGKPKMQDTHKFFLMK